MHGSHTVCPAVPRDAGSVPARVRTVHSPVGALSLGPRADFRTGADRCRLDLPDDWALGLRMMEADVRIGMVEEETVDDYPSRHWTPRWKQDLPEPDCAPREWEYVPEGFERARRAGEQAAVGWGAEEVARAYREKWPEFLEAIEGPGPLGVSHETHVGMPTDRHQVLPQNTVLAFAFALACAANAASPRSVLDGAVCSDTSTSSPRGCSQTLISIITAERYRWCAPKAGMYYPV